MKIIVIGGGGHAKSLGNLILQCGHELVGFVDSRMLVAEIFGRKVVRSLDDFVEERGGVGYAMGIGDNYQREKYKQLSQIPAMKFPALVHPSAVVGKQVTIESGVQVFPHTTIGPGCTLRAFSLLNTGAILEHDSVLGEYGSLGPGAVTGGHVALGSRSALCMGATVKNGVSVGDDVVIGAASYVHHDLPSNVLVYGVPAKVVRSRQADETYY